MKPYVVYGQCVLSLYERCDMRPPSSEVPAVIVRGGIPRISEIVSSYPEYAEAESDGLVIKSPPSYYMYVVRSVCCIKPRAVGRDLVYASTRPARLEVEFASLRIYYDVEPSREYTREL